MKASATISLPAGVTPTSKGNGNVCVVVEGKMVDGVLQGTEVMSIEDYMKSGKEPEMPKKPKKKGKERPARIKAILGDEDESMGY